MFEAGVVFDGAAFYRHVTAALPTFARPAFVRLLAQAELTGTFKVRKVELQRQGFDPAASDDPIFVRDDASETYAQLDQKQHARIAAGDQRL